MFSEIGSLLRKDIQTEFRHKASINGTLLYLISTIFVVYLVFSFIEELHVWIGMFWIVLVFAATNAIGNGFKAEANRQYHYYYYLCNPKSILFSKLVFNSILLTIIGLLSYSLFGLLVGNPIENTTLFLCILILGIWCISSILTLTSAIASRTDNNSTLTAILSFPILLPTLLTAIKASMLSGLGFGWADCQNYMLTLVLLNVVTVALSYVLFPYLWRS